MSQVMDQGGSHQVGSEDEWAVLNLPCGTVSRWENTVLPNEPISLQTQCPQGERVEFATNGG